MNRPDELKGLLQMALAASLGILLQVTGGNSGSGPQVRQTALAALSAAKRELQASIPEVINLQFKSVAGMPDHIAIRHIPPEDTLELDDLT